MDLTAGRKVLFHALVGSHNYGLNTSESDKDYKVFVAPTFDDLYFNSQFSKAYIGDVADYDIHDIRKVSSLWWKANVNFIEVLFSNEFVINHELDSKTKSLIEEILYIKDDIARMNLPYLYDACIGMHITKKKLIDKGTEGTQHLVEKYGFDTKQAMHSIRILYVLSRFAYNGFTDFKEAIWFGNEIATKHWLLDIKNGRFTKEQYLEIADRTLKATERLRDTYKSQRPNQETHDKLIKLTKEIVKVSILQEAIN